MKLKITYLSILLISGTLLGQVPTQKNAPNTLDEISIKGTSVPELDLSRSSILTKNQINDRQIQNLVDLSSLTPNLHINANGIQSYGDIISIRGIANTQFLVRLEFNSILTEFHKPMFLPILLQCMMLKVSKYCVVLKVTITESLLLEVQLILLHRTFRNEQTNELSASHGTFNSQKYNFTSKGPLSDGFSYSLALQKSTFRWFINNSAGRDNTSKTWHGALIFVDEGEGTKIRFGANFETHELGANLSFIVTRMIFTPDQRISMSILKLIGINNFSLLKTN